MKITKKSSEKSTEQKMAPYCGWCCFIFMTVIFALAFSTVVRHMGGDQPSFNELILFIGVFMYLALKYEWG